VTKAFCPKCGRPLFGATANAADDLTVSRGTMEDAAGLAVEVVIDDAEAAGLGRAGRQRLRFAGQPDWRPDG
jgi:hypothetical protein